MIELARLCMSLGGEEFTVVHEGSTWTVVLHAETRTAEVSS